ncbi:MAG TPA: hypothetical protein VHE34_09395 [Puia sp.]|uniref:hypothetical protein n=1 Tax=Puia sp. TaxID=2045100 RepID=UPI002BFB0214|nr:hypothetical protein [Puia sp.]HVU95428.1 hypothetical protein [Puia sp.]
MNKLLLSFILAVLLLWVLNPILISHFFSTLEERSKFADTYNVVNSLFAGLGFAVLLFTLIVQKKEIRNQVDSVNKTNRLSYLTSLLNFYSAEEEKYKDEDRVRGEEMKKRKDQILNLINKEVDKLS